MTRHQTMGLALAMLFPLVDHCAAADAPATGFYKQPPLFSTAADVKAQLTTVERFAPVGIGEIWRRSAIWLLRDNKPARDCEFKEEDLLRQWTPATSLFAADWQALQDPYRSNENPETRKTKWDGHPTELAATPVDLRFKALTFRDDGTTGDPLWLWTTDILMALEWLQASKMTPKTIDGTDYLFIEAAASATQTPRAGNRR